MDRSPGQCALRSVCWLVLPAALLAISCRRSERVDRATAAPTTMTTKSGFAMVAIPAGTFQMGSNDGLPDEQPVHEVSVDGFLMDRHEVTQAEYAKFVVGNPSHFKGADRPVEQIGWAAAALFCNQRSRAEGLTPCYDEETAACDYHANGYRLPTEAEWEYACRAGHDWGAALGRNARELGKYVWYAANAGKQTHPVGTKKPNQWGLFDMLGNVAEWCNDVYREDFYATSPKRNPRGPAEGEKYVLRGGAWNSKADACRPAYRIGEDPGFQDACFARDAIGFRCVRRP